MKDDISVRELDLGLRNKALKEDLSTGKKPQNTSSLLAQVLRQGTKPLRRLAT